MSPISDDECDVAIRILDVKAKGNRKGDESVANVMTPMGAWRRLFNILHTGRKLGRLVDAIFSENDLNRKAGLIDELQKAAAGKGSRLTGEGATVLNALLAAYDPISSLSIVSLNDRKAMMNFLKLSLPIDWSQASYGTRIVQSNSLLCAATRNLGIEGSARTLSCFWYFGPVTDLWRSEHRVHGPDTVSVTVPDNTDVDTDGTVDEAELRESLQVQATLAAIGAQMGFQIWLPRSDRARVLSKWKPAEEELLEHLPVGFGQATMKTIEQIDVLWIKRRSIVRAFEVEHTTSVYSGLLRMADLLAMQPNLKIRLHIVAPLARAEKVLREIRRPVFMLLEGGPLSGACTYLSYDSVAEIRGQEYLNRLSHEVLEDFEVRAEEGD
jgi:hypothetical protein